MNEIKYLTGDEYNCDSDFAYGKLYVSVTIRVGDYVYKPERKKLVKLEVYSITICSRYEDCSFTCGYFHNSGDFVTHRIFFTEIGKTIFLQKEDYNGEKERNKQRNVQENW